MLKCFLVVSRVQIYTKRLLGHRLKQYRTHFNRDLGIFQHILFCDTSSVFRNSESIFNKLYYDFYHALSNFALLLNMN